MTSMGVLGQGSDTARLPLVRQSDALLSVTPKTGSLSWQVFDTGTDTGARYFVFFCEYAPLYSAVSAAAADAEMDNQNE